MNRDRLCQIISSHIKDARVMAVGDNGKFDVTVISKVFNGLSTVDRHRLVYAAVNQEIETGTVHALSIRTYTEEEARSEL